MRSYLLQPLYSVALDGLPLLGTPAETAGRSLVRHGTLRERAEEMSQTHLALCAGTGFVCGLGGFLTLPITLPVNVSGVALIQLHLCASMAFLASENPVDPHVQNRIFDCITGAAEGYPDRDEAQEVLDRSAVKIAERGLRLVAEATVSLAQAAGKATARNAVLRRLPRRSLPLVGGVIGGASDLYATRRVVEAALEEFIPKTGNLLTESASYATTNGTN